MAPIMTKGCDTLSQVINQVKCNLQNRCAHREPARAGLQIRSGHVRSGALRLRLAVERAARCDWGKGNAVGILTEDMKHAVGSQLGFIATVCRDGTPNLSPKGTTAVWDDDHLVFAHIQSPGTVDNLRTNPNIEINVVDQLVRKGYRFMGVAVVHTDGDVFQRGVQFYDERGTPNAAARIKAIVIVTVQRALAVTSPAYDLGATEEELRERWLARLTDRSS